MFYHCGTSSSGVSRERQFASRKMISLTGIRFFIEFSSILVLAFLCIMHEFTDVTLAKQFNIDHASSNQASLDEVEQQAAASSLYNHLLSTDDEQSAVRFTPESLDFGHQPISMPVIETVYIHNRHDESNIQMISISGNTEHFHCSFFEDKVVPVQSNTSFQVVFLARQEGLVNNTLYIHSSVGSFQYRVSAFGEASPFRVRPLIGARVPLNSSFASLIYVYNPFATPLQLTEMYTSGGGLHLELPNDESEAPSNLWKVPPYETRPVMKAHFVARIASNHTSYIRIRTNATDFQLMLPVEVEVSNSPGLYSPLDTVDFGVLRAKHDQPKVMPIQVINAAMKSIHVQNIVVTPLSDGLTVEFDGPTKLSPRSSSPYHIANLVLDPARFSCTGLCSGKILIKSKNNQYKLSIPFIVRIIQGELYFNDSLSHFFVNQCSTYSEQRLLSVENRFDSPIIVHDITVPAEAKPYFKLTTEHPLPLALPVGVSFPLLKLEFTPSPQLSHFSTAFRLLTNFSHFDLPLFAYRGRLDLFIPNSLDQTKLDIGLVGLSEKKSLTFVIANHNPIAIRLNYWHCNLTGIVVELVGTSHGNVTAISQRIEPSGLSRSEITLLQPSHFAVFRVHVDKISKEGVYNGQIMIKTPFETLNVPLMLKVLRGSLSADKVILPKTFPGRMVTAYLNVKSNYTSQIKIKGAFIEPKDERFQIKLSDKLIKPGQDNKIAITFDATALCLQRLCYSALDVEKEVGHLWLLGTGLYSDTAYIDKELYKLLRNQWLLLGESDRNPAVNVRLQVDGFGSFTTEAQAQLHWPRLSNKLVIRFSSIRIGRTVTKDLVIENPADRSILVQAINVVDYPNSDVLLQLISNGIFHQQWPRGDIESIHAAIRNGQNTSAFYFVNSSTTSPPPPQASPSLNSNSNRINDWLGVEPNSNSYTMLLPPGARQRLTVAFQPQFEGNVTSLLILRNNLTIVEVVMLRGEGGRGLLKIGTAVPNSSTNSKLMFEFSERNLERKCRNAMQKVDFSKQQHFINSLIIKEKFKATNVGRMGLQIRHFLIDGMACEGYGFHINRCEPIFLLPNQTFEMEIVYSPDFTQPTVTHELRIIVDDDPMNSQTFKLVANVPQKLLQSCLAALPRPVWENFIYYLLLSMALLVLLLSIIVAISDAHRITFNYSMQLLKMEKSKSRAESNGCNGSMANSNGYDCPNNTNTTDSSYSKNKLIDSNGIVANGNHNSNQNSNHQKQSSLSKVRNRKGSSNNSNNHRNSNSNSINRNKSSQQQHSTNTSSNSRPELTKSEELPQYNLSNSDQTSTQTTTTASNWSYVLRKKLLRQDSSSSEQSQPSSDSNNSTSSKNIGKDLDYSNRSKSMNGDIASIVPQQEQSISKIAQTDRKSKKEEKKSTEPTKNGKNKNSKSGKSQKPAQKLLEKTINQADSTKSSSESLNFSSTTGTPKFDPMEVIPKVRSATLPLINDQKSSFNENMSISQSNILPNLYENNQRFVESIENQNGQMRMKGYNNGAQKQTGRNFERSDSAYGNRNRNVDSAGYPRHQDSSRVSPPPGFAERNKDIWDHPITTFDSELAMSMLVKQTEEFAANGNEKLGSHHRFSNENHGRKFVGQSERNNNKMVSRLNDDKWEIGEWSNDLAKHAASMMNNNKNNNGSNKSMDDPKDHYYNYHNQHQQQQPQMDNRRPSFRDLDNRLSNNLSMNDYQQLRNQLQHSYKQNSSANFRNSATSSYGIVNPLPVGSSTAASGPSSISKNSSLSSNSPGFSPVIGRPTPPPTQQQQQTSSLLSGQHVPSRFNSVHSKFSNEFSNFVTKNDSPPIDLPFNGPFGSAKTNLDLDLSFLEQNSLRYPNGPITSTGSSALIQPPTLISDNYHRPSLNTFLDEAPEWNRHPLDSFPISSSTFISSPDSLTKSSVSNIFSFENESVWTSTAASPSSSSLWSTPPITNAGSNSKSSKAAFGFGVGSALDDKIINSSWPSAPSLSNGNASSGLVQPSNHHQQFAPGSGQEYGKFAKTTQNSNNSRVWSPFDYYDYSSGSSNIDLTQRPISGTATLPPQPPPLSTSISNKNHNNNPKILSDIGASSTPIGFENSSTVFGLFGSSPWSPLGTSPTETTTSPIISTPTPPLPASSSPQLSALGEATAASDLSSNNNNLTGLSPPISLESSQSIADPFNGRFSRNISPSPSSTSTNLSSDTATSGATNTSSSRSSSSNQADCGETSEKSASLI